jgi:hypothetical protein
LVIVICLLFGICDLVLSVVGQLPNLKTMQLIFETQLYPDVQNTLGIATECRMAGFTGKENGGQGDSEPRLKRRLKRGTTHR